jgi:hypothetical protein
MKTSRTALPAQVITHTGYTPAQLAFADAFLAANPVSPYDGLPVLTAAERRA